MEFSAVDSGIVLLNTKPALLVYRTVIVTKDGHNVFSKGVEKTKLKNEQQAVMIRTSKRLFLEYSACLSAPGLVFLDGSLAPPSFEGEWEIPWKKLINSGKKVIAVSKDSFEDAPEMKAGEMSRPYTEGNIASFFYKRLPWEQPLRVDTLNVSPEFAFETVKRNTVGATYSKFLPTEVADFHARLRDYELRLIASQQGVLPPRRSFKIL